MPFSVCSVAKRWWELGDQQITHQRTQIYRLFAVTFFLSLAFYTWRSVLNNFLVEDLGATGFDRGLMEAVREVPGLLSVLFMAVVGTIAQPVLGFLCMLLLAGGTLAFSFSQDVNATLIPLFIASMGIHLWIPVRQSLLLALTHRDVTGAVLGDARAVGGIAALLGSALVYFSVTHIGYRGVFVGSTAAAVLGGLVMLGLFGIPTTKHKDRILVRRRYRLFYLLTMLDGCRRQIFITFALFALVSVHGATVREITVVLAVSQAINVVVHPLIGRCIDRFGERALLLVGAVVPIFVFIGYAFVYAKPVLFGLYCLDSACLGTNIARTTYLNKIAPREDVLPSLSFGLTMNHVIAVPLPLVGGILWERFGHAATFFTGVGIAVVAVIASNCVPPKKDLAGQQADYPA